MIVVSDTTPLMTLIKIDRLSILSSIFGKVLIPRTVYSELTSNPKYSSEAGIISECDFITVSDISDYSKVNMVQRVTGLDSGESEAIILSDELHADILLMDEMKGRRVAKQMGLKIMGTVGLLLAAYDEALISQKDVLDCIDRWRSSGQYLSEKYYRILLNRVKGDD